MVWLKFIICVAIIFFAGQRVAKYGDILAEKTGMGRIWMGVIAIALITSLPELFTGISAVTLVEVPDLTIGDLIGANAFNLFNLALLDIAYRNSSIFFTASRTHRLTSWFSLILLVVVAISIVISIYFSNMSLGWIGWYTPVILVLYLLFIRKIFYYEKQHPPDQSINIYDDEACLRKTLVLFCIAAVFIIGAGIWLATIGDEIAHKTGWGQSFVGSLFLAFTTTLPEITVSFTLMRIGATDMAIANIIGSNLFNLSIIPIIDIIYSKGPILAEISESHLVTAAVVFSMTLLLITALMFRPGRYLRLNWFNVSLVILFLTGTYLSFTIS